jgi:hypothetical protein
VDDILYTYITLKDKDENPTFEKYDEQMVLNILSRMRKNEYKRYLPIVLPRLEYEDIC